MNPLSFADALPPLLVCVGESILTHPIGGPTWPDQFKAANPSWQVVNLGHDGRLTSEIDYEGTVRPLLNPLNAKQIVVIQTGLNDDLQSHTVDSTVQQISLLVSKIFNGGAYPLVGTATADGFMNTDADNRRMELNEILRAQYPQNLIDFAAPWFRFSTLADTTNTAIFSDTVHATAYGATGLFTIAAPHILGAPNTCPSVVFSLASNVITLPAIEGFALVQQ